MNTIQYYILIDGSEHGPMSLTRLRAHLLARGVKATDRAWRDGMLGWRPLGTFVNVPALLAEEEKKQSYEPALASVGRRIAATLLDVFAFWLVCVIALFIAMIGARIMSAIATTAMISSACPPPLPDEVRRRPPLNQSMRRPIAARKYRPR